MPTPTVTIIAPPPVTYPDPGIVRPRSLVRWTGGVGPFEVLHEWDTAPTFDTGDLIQDNNPGATSPDTGEPDADMGPPGTGWFYRVTVTDTDDNESATPATINLAWVDPIEHNRYLYLLANAGVGFFPTDTGNPDHAADGHTIEHNRYLYLLANAGVGFFPTDTGNPDHAADGHTIDFNRYLYLLAGDVDNTVPTPHIWYVFPNFGREGWEFKIIGFGFGDTQGTYNGAVLLNALGCSVIDWQLIAETSDDLTIDHNLDIAEPVHQQVRAVVPVGAESGLVFVTTDA